MKNNTSLVLTLPLPVSVNHYIKHRVSKGKGRPFIHSYKVKEACDFDRLAMQIINREMVNQKWITPEPHKFIRVEAVWYFNKKGRDTSNMHKQVLDALQKCNAYHNDSMVLECSNDYYIDSKNPRCVIELTVMEKQGVFKNQEDKLEFCKCNCHNCTKDKKSCTFFKKLLENRIIPEIDLINKKCSKIKLKKSNKEAKEC